MKSALFLLAVAVMTACTAPPTPLTGSPIPPVEQSAAAQPSASTDASPQPAAERPVLAETTAAVDLFSEPDTATPILTEVAAGQTLLVMSSDAPQGWLRVEAPVANSIEFVFGWIASQQAGGPALTEVQVRCPPLGTGLGFYHPEIQRSCADGAELEIEGQVVATPGTNRVFVGDPAWLAQVPAIYLSGAGEMRGGLPIHLPPDLEPKVSIGDLVQLSGHYDDERASTCRREPSSPEFALESSEEQELWCRQRLVIDSIAPLND